MLRFFSHPDCTVGFGISPNRLNGIPSSSRAVTAGREFHPTPKKTSSGLCSCRNYYNALCRPRQAQYRVKTKLRLLLSHPWRTNEETEQEGDCQGVLPLTEIRSGGVYGARTENFCKERRRLKEIFRPCGFSARKSHWDFRKNRRGFPKGGRIPPFALLRSQRLSSNKLRLAFAAIFLYHTSRKKL